MNKINKKFNSISIIAFIFSCISAFNFEFIGILGAFLGIVAFCQIESSKEKGLLLSVLAVAIGIIFGFKIF